MTSEEWADWLDATPADRYRYSGDMFRGLVANLAAAEKRAEKWETAASGYISMLPTGDRCPSHRRSSMTYCPMCGQDHDTTGRPTDLGQMLMRAPRDCPSLYTEAECRERERAAFVAGGDFYWQSQGHENGLPNMERDRQEAEAERRYGEGRKT